MSDSGSISRDGVALAWDPDARLARLWFTAAAHLGGGHAAIVVEGLASFVGDAPQPYGVLIDGAGVLGADAEYRAKCRRFFSTHRENVHLAAYHLGPIVRVTVDMFRVGTGVQIKAFADEAAARSWLREHGTRA